MHQRNAIGLVNKGFIRPNHIQIRSLFDIVHEIFGNRHIQMHCVHGFAKFQRDGLRFMVKHRGRDDGVKLPRGHKADIVRFADQQINIHDIEYRMDWIFNQPIILKILRGDFLKLLWSWVWCVVSRKKFHSKFFGVKIKHSRMICAGHA
jgi:hypothetical protein